MLKAMILLLFPLFSFGSPAWSGTKVKLADGKAELKVSQSALKNLELEVHRDGKLLQTFVGLGKTVEKIRCNGQEATLCTFDFDKSGNQGFLLRTVKTTLIGALWVFRWDSKEKAFAHVLNEHGDRYIPVPRDAPVSLSPEGALSFFQAGAPKAKTFHWHAGHFKED